MKLYYTPGTCSLASHIAIREAGLPIEIVKVDLKAKTTERGEDYLKINPKGYVATLVLDDGEILTEAPAILQYVADLKPESKLAPPAGTLERYRLIEWLNFVATEIHKQFSPFFNPKLPPEWRENQVAVLGKRFAVLAETLGKKPYLMGETFTVADCYLFTVLRWHQKFNVDISPWPALGEYLKRVAARPAVQETLKTEGLIP